MHYSKKEDIIDDYHGIKVKDQYRWLEDDYSSETTAWVEEQNNQTFNYIHNIPAYNIIKKRLSELWNYPKYFVPHKAGNRYFYFKNEGMQNQPVLYMQISKYDEPKVVLDPNKFSEDGTVAITNYSFNPEGTLLAYGFSKNGSDWQEIKIINLQTNKNYDESIKWVKFTKIAWLHDSSGFFYSRFPQPGTVPKEEENNYNAVYLHIIGTPQTKDLLIYPEASGAKYSFLSTEKEFSYSPVISSDGEYLILTIYIGTSLKNKVYLRKINNSENFITLIDIMDAKYTFVGNKGTIFYFLTDKHAPHCRLIGIDISKPEEKYWKEIIPDQRKILVNANIIKDYIVATFIENASHRLEIYQLDGTFIDNIDLPFIGSITEITCNHDDTEILFGLTSFLHPTNIYSYDIVTKSLALFMKANTPLDTIHYETKQIFFPSRDGTKIPMFITHKKDLKLNGNNPTLLYGYGGFNISLTPSFFPSVQFWLENGGIFAVANLRGGNEYGEKWHQAGILAKKQNVFDDFIAAAEWLIENQYTQPAKLGIMGRSNGGLLVAACMIQKPYLYGAVICNVPVIDMLRYHKFTVGRYWISEYGNAEQDKDHFNFLYAYSPLHNVKGKISYPPIIIATADQDDRVVSLHARKFTAALQAVQTSENPILLRVEKNAGHGQGKPTAKVLEEEIDFYTFLFKELKVIMYSSR